MERLLLDALQHAGATRRAHRKTYKEGYLRNGTNSQRDFIFPVGQRKILKIRRSYSKWAGKKREAPP